MAANRRKQDDKNLEILRELITKNGNKYCLDCNQRGPTYVNTTIGSFVCSKCSGMLRGLTPPHRVKSISMATFTPEEIDFIKIRGNDYCRRVWLGLYEGESVNFTDEQSVRDFMSDKYEKRRYYLEAQQNILATTNGKSSSKNKSKAKTGSGVNTAPLISIPSPVLKSAINNNVNHSSAKVANNLVPAVNNIEYKSPKVTNVLVQPFVNNINVNNAPVPDFPVDFSTADIYNGSQYSTNNNFMTSTSTIPSSQTTTAFDAFNPPTTASNDRYAALADLDLALRQQKMKTMEESSVENKNPFQSATTNDFFANKNPFFNGNWSTTTESVSVNPFVASTTNNAGCVNSNNPFL